MDLKRSADRLFYVNAPLFSDEFRRTYEEFINRCFIPGPLNEYDATAKLRTDVRIRKELFKKRQEVWNPEWDRYFAPADNVTSRDDIVASYWRLMDTFARELGVGLRDRL